MRLVLVGNQHFLLPNVVRAVVVILLDGLVFVYLLETVGFQLVVYDID